MAFSASHWVLCSSLLYLSIGERQAQAIDSYVDRDAVINLVLETADAWNGGVDGQSGLGAYSADWNGLFLSDLSRSFAQTNPTSDQTVISQSRAIYFNVEAYRVASGASRSRYLSIIQQGADYLIDHAWDDTYGGVYWGLEANGSTPPSSTQKEAYGQVHTIFSLCHAYAVTGDSDHLDFAWQVYRQFEDRHADISHPGAYRPTQSRSYAFQQSENNFDYMLHYFEALLALHDVTIGTKHAEVKETLTALGYFMTGTLVHPLGGDTAFVSYWYGSDWDLHPRAYNPQQLWTPSRFSTAGHGIEFAWLISRAVERGYDPDWLDTGRKLLEFARRYAINPSAGGMLYDRLNTDGSIIPDGSQTVSMIWWPQAETARALLNWAFLRNEDTWDEFSTTDTLILNWFIDPIYGGMYDSFVVSNPSLSVGSWVGQPTTSYKGSIWKVNYHATMNWVEQIRLSEIQDPLIASSYAFTDFERTSSPDETSPAGDFDDDKLSNLFEYAMGTDPRYPNKRPYDIIIDVSNRTVTARFRQSKTALNIRIVVESSSDLLAWNASDLTPSKVEEDAQTITLQDTLPIQNDSAFYRISVSSTYSDIETD